VSEATPVQSRSLLDSPKGLERDIERARAKLRAIKKIEKP
jgi:hypothetical protein